MTTEREQDVADVESLFRTAVRGAYEIAGMNEQAAATKAMNEGSTTIVPLTEREQELHDHYASNATTAGHTAECAKVTEPRNWPQITGRPSCTCGRTARPLSGRAYSVRDGRTVDTYTGSEVEL